MSLNREELQELSNLLSSITLDKETKFPISNISKVPFTHMDSEIVYHAKNGKIYTFTIEEAIKESGYKETLITLDSNGMHYYYANQKEKKQLWIPDIYTTLKDINGSVVVMQEFPEDGKCKTQFLEVKNIDDPSVAEFLDKDVVIFNNANFYIQKSSLEGLSQLCNSLWKSDLLKGGYSS